MKDGYPLCHNFRKSRSSYLSPPSGWFVSGCLVQGPPASTIGDSGTYGLEVMSGSQREDERNCCIDERRRGTFEVTEAMLVDDRKKINVVRYGRILIG
jgi:hypothetical protein